MEYTTSVYGQARPWRALDDVIRKAAARRACSAHGGRSLDAKKAKTDLRGLAALANVELRVVTIPQWSGGPIDFARLIHSKYVVIDGGASGWVGSENWSEGYFTNTRNVGLIVNDPAVAGQLPQVYSKVWTSAYASSAL